MNITARLDMLINGAFANGQTDTFNALRLLRDDAARLEADAARLRGIIARNARTRLNGEDGPCCVTADDIKQSLEILYAEQAKGDA